MLEPHGEPEPAIDGVQEAAAVVPPKAVAVSPAWLKSGPVVSGQQGLLDAFRKQSTPQAGNDAEHQVAADASPPWLKSGSVAEGHCVVAMCCSAVHCVALLWHGVGMVLR